jgi:hypothetical protein
MSKPSVIFAALLVVTGCAERPAGQPEHVREVRIAAERDACISRELLLRGREQVEALAPLAQVEPGAGHPAVAAYRFAVAYAQHAELRHTAFAHIDSAVNIARQPQDSLRYVGVAERIVFRLPEPGTVEANIMNPYQRDFDGLRADPDHRCNW